MAPRIQTEIIDRIFITSASPPPPVPGRFRGGASGGPVIFILSLFSRRVPSPMPT